MHKTRFADPIMKRGDHGGGQPMKSIHSRLRKLEDWLGLTVDLEYEKEIEQRLEAGWRRIKEAEESGLYKRPEEGPDDELHRRRFMAALGFGSTRKR
jgi:hypothetical protein